MAVQTTKPTGASVFQDILVVVVNTKDDEVALRAVDELGAQFGGHATALLVSPLPQIYYAGDGMAGMTIWSTVLAQLREDAQKETAALKARIAKASIPIDVRVTEIEYYLSRDAALMSARHADITVFTRPLLEDDPYRRDIIEAVIFQSGRPAFVLPSDWAKPIKFKNIVVAWKPTREAARAVGDAMPLLEAADKITLVTVDATPSTLGVGQQPGADIATHLARRGVNVEVRNLDGMGRSDGDCILDAAHAVDADLVVLGAYGHSRVREVVFGGVTKRLLQAADVPLFLSH